jgi:DNA-binding FrmR family transcriptional regulator
MAKQNSGVSDIELIKEIESLRLKQKLLLQTLKNNEKAKKDSVFRQIDTKLDFLMKIFEDATSDEDTKEENNIINKKLDDIVKRISAIETAVKGLGGEVKESTEGAENTEKKPEEEKPEEEKPEEETAKENSTETETEENSEKEKPEGSNMNLPETTAEEIQSKAKEEAEGKKTPPKPDFEGNAEEQTEEKKEEPPKPDFGGEEKK